eukprot:144446_1
MGKVSAHPGIVPYNTVAKPPPSRCKLWTIVTVSSILSMGCVGLFAFYMNRAHNSTFTIIGTSLVMVAFFAVSIIDYTDRMVRGDNHPGVIYPEGEDDYPGVTDYKKDKKKQKKNTTSKATVELVDDELTTSESVEAKKTR